MAERSDIAALLSRLQHPSLPVIELGLERVHALLARLGNPHTSLPPVIHVAGTNGKGSLIAFLQAMFEAAGKRVHRYTSPHLVRFSERIVLAGKEIDDDTLLHTLIRVEEAARGLPVTFFEATTAAAFLAFSEHKADVVLLETGMGGRLDATNVVPRPQLTAITPVSYDHQEYLGKTLADIAAEKAGILKPGVPCVLGPQAPEAEAVITRTAEHLGAPLLRYGYEWRVEREKGQWYYRSQHLRLPLTPSLAGEHQYINAATAVACMEALKADIPPGVLARGMTQTRWLGRLQPLPAPEGIALWLDGAHNPHGAEALAAWARAQPQPLHLICGMKKDKDITGFLAPLSGICAGLHAVAILGEECHAPEAIAAQGRAFGIKSDTVGSVQDALEHIPAPATVLICGSLYLAGRVLSELESLSS